MYEAKFLDAVECSVKDRETLFTIYDFPAEHWRSSIRTTNTIEGTSQNPLESAGRHVNLV